MTELDSTRPPSVLASLNLGEDGIYTGGQGDGGQEHERKLRGEVAAKAYDDYLGEIAHHHSIPVMDAEIDRFLATIPTGGIIVDVGGCWGWHWRRLADTRPDIRVVVVDFVRANLRHAQTLLKDDIGRRVFLVEGDATRLDFPDACFDGYWSVQTLQHIPAFPAAIAEAARVLKHRGSFACYSLNDPPLIRAVYALFGKYWHRQGTIPGAFWLERMNQNQIDTVTRTFGVAPRQHYSEVLFTPEFGLRIGARGNWAGRVDAALSGSGWPRLIARQHSLHLTKPGV
ncbi:class I SAM-dependent methyltransferase [Magnetospirillum sp. 64-120]|uniref:class I SAM-dependent methyltransferase n=1 Tax=Magnetospirillum sp. 64-120 TaxID=1895778 RepID=UPI00092A18BC|nr:class I SAM-dependent methyltransferase [Magnetospirillum sp. 64-120]OJX68159.1 MAG: hypothetical protein BGO92_05760 [Magnetospirillum sp. 64-120]